MVVVEGVVVLTVVEVVDGAVEVVKDSVIRWVSSLVGGYSQIQWSLDWQDPGSGTFLSSFKFKYGHMFCHTEVLGRLRLSLRTQNFSSVADIFNFSAAFEISEYSMENMGSLCGFARFPPWKVEIQKPDVAFKSLHSHRIRLGPHRMFFSNLKLFPNLVYSIVLECTKPQWDTYWGYWNHRNIGVVCSNLLGSLGDKVFGRTVPARMETCNMWDLDIWICFLGFAYLSNFLLLNEHLQTARVNTSVAFNYRILCGTSAAVG